MKLARRPWAVDRRLGYPTYRGWALQQCLPDVVAHARPDVIVCQGWEPEMPEIAVATGVPTFVLFRVVPEPGWTTLPRAGLGGLMANSMYCARAVRERFGIDPVVVRPPIDRATYRTEVDPREVTVIGLVKKKGAETVLAIAERLPHIPFRIFTNQLHLPDEARDLLQRAKALANVTLNPPVASDGRLYRRARIVLAPSVWEETWGRIATEAHVNAVPVVASDRGGLPEAVGEGGLCLPLDAPIEAWVDAVRAMFEDEALYQRYREGARRQDRSPLIQPDHIVDTLVAALETGRTAVGAAGVSAA